MQKALVQGPCSWLVYDTLLVPASLSSGIQSAELLASPHLFDPQNVRPVGGTQLQESSLSPGHFPKLLGGLSGCGKKPALGLWQQGGWAWVFLSS